MATTTKEIAVKDLKPSPHKREGHGDVAELAKSIREVGLLQPCIVRPNKKGYEVCAGTRRFLACKKLKMETVACIVREMSDEEAMSVALTENLQREDLTPWEESKMVGDLLAKFDAKTVADMQGKTLTWVYTRARLRLLTKPWQEAAADPESPVSQWPASHLLEIAKLAPESQDYLIDRTHIDDFYTREELVSFVAANTNLISLAPWDIEDAALVPEVGSCVECPLRSDRNPGLFDNGSPVEGEDRCLNSRCWLAKGKVFSEIRIAELREKNPNTLMVRDKADYMPQDSPEEALSPYSYTEVDPGTKDSVQAVVVGNSDRAGQVIHIADPTKDLDHGGKRKVRAKGVPTPLPERKAQLKRRRIKRACALLVDELNALERQEPDTLYILAAAVGTKSNNGAGNGWEGVTEDGKSRPNPWVLASRYVGPKLSDYLWERILPVLTDRIGYRGADQDMMKLWKDATAMGNFLDIDTAALLKLAEADIPIPKSWKNLNQDGTPKAKKR